MQLAKTILQKGLRQSDVAARIGIDEPTMSKFVNYKCLPIPSTMARLLGVLDCDIHTIYTPQEITFPKSVTTKKRSSCYKLSVRLPKEDKELIKKALKACGYKNVTFWINACLSELKRQYSEKRKASLPIKGKNEAHTTPTLYNEEIKKSTDYDKKR